MYKGKKLVPKDLQTLKIHASALRNSLVAAEAAGGPRARARCVVRVSRHGATLSPRPALGACQPCPSMIHARARACSDDGCLRMTARTHARAAAPRMSRGSLSRALSMDRRAARSPFMTVMMLSHSICPPARRNLMLVSAGGTQAHVGDMKSTLGCCGRGGRLRGRACSVGCAGQAQASDCCICAQLRIECL